MVPSTEVKILLTLFVFICLTLYNIAFKESNAASFVKGPPRGAPPVPASVLEKAKSVAKAATVHPPRGPPKPSGIPKPPVHSSSSIEAQLERESESVLAADANRTSTGGAKKKRFSGGVALFNPGLGALNLNALKKVDRSDEKSKARPSQTFERPSLRHVQTPSTKKLGDNKSSRSINPFESSVQEDEDDEEEEEPMQEMEVEDPDADDGAKEGGGEEEIVWEQRLDPTHNVHFYLNIKTQEAVWEAPEKFKLTEESASSEGGGGEEFEWEQMIDDASGVYYYFNAKTQEASWDVPARYKPLETAVAAEREEFEWEQRLDPTHNIHYYFNLKTQETSWEAPEKFKPMA